MTCRGCEGTGIYYDQTGHRHSRYPFAEKTNMVVCRCPHGDRLRDQSKAAIAAELAAKDYADDILAQQEMKGRRK